ncbi:hypothetical protein ABTM07_20855, partial [Acinetobacter baumannii]
VHYKSVVRDLSRSNSEIRVGNDQSFNIQHSTFDIILCDAPCSGSGTWGRTPEQLFFFDTKKIDEFYALQTKIVSNT